MSPLQLLSGLLAAAVASPVSAALPPRICALIAGEGDPSFDRFTVSGNTKCRCESAAVASCAPLAAYPTVAPNSPEALLNQYHQPSSTALQAMLAFQIQVTCRSYQAQGRRCLTAWPADGSGAPVCDCATADGQISIRTPYFVDNIRSRVGRERQDEEN